MIEDDHYEEDIYTEEELEEQEQKEQEKELEDFLYSKFHYASKVDVETDPDVGSEKNGDVNDGIKNTETNYPEISETTTWNGILGTQSKEKENIINQSAVVAEDLEWNINEKDLNENGNKSTTKRYYLGEELPNIFCYNCGLKGHIGKECTKEKKIPTCSLCGTDGHMRRDCLNEFCFNCMETGHKARDCTGERLKPRHLRHCNRCRKNGHVKQDCPEYWRQYHLTIESGPIIRLLKGRGKSNNENRFCFNCASTKHFGEECKDERFNKGPVYGQFVVNYDPCTTEGYNVSKKDKSKRDKDETEKKEKRKELKESSESKESRRSRKKDRDSSPVEAQRKRSREKSSKDLEESPKDSPRSRNSKEKRKKGLVDSPLETVGSSPHDEKEKRRTVSPSDSSKEHDKKENRKKKRDESPIGSTSSKSRDNDASKEEDVEKEKGSKKKRKRESEKEETKEKKKEKKISFNNEKVDDPSKKKSKSSKDKECEKKDDKKRSYENIRRNMWISDDDISFDRTESSAASKIFSLIDHLKIGIGISKKRKGGSYDNERTDKKRKTKSRDEKEQTSSQSNENYSEGEAKPDISDDSKRNVLEKTSNNENIKTDKTIVTKKTDSQNKSVVENSKITKSTKSSEWMEQWEDANDGVNENDEKYDLLQRVDSSEVTEIVLDDDDNSNDSVETLDFNPPTTKMTMAPDRKPDVILIEDDDEETSETTQVATTPPLSPTRIKTKPNRTVSESPRSKKYKMNVKALNNLKTIYGSDSDDDSEDDRWVGSSEQPGLDPQPNFHCDEEEEEEDGSDVSVTEVVSLDGGDIEERTTLDYNQTPRVSPTTPPTTTNDIFGTTSAKQKDLTYYDPRAIYQEHLIIYNLINVTQTCCKANTPETELVPDTSFFGRRGGRRRVTGDKWSSAPADPFFIPWMDRNLLESRMEAGQKMYVRLDLAGFAEGIMITKWKADGVNHVKQLIKEGARCRGIHVTASRLNEDVSNVRDGKVNPIEKDLTYYDPRAVYQEHLVIYNLITATQNHTVAANPYKVNNNASSSSSTFNSYRSTNPLHPPRTSQRQAQSKTASIVPFFLPWVHQNEVRARLNRGARIYTKSELTGIANSKMVKHWIASSNTQKTQLRLQGIQEHRAVETANHHFNDMCVQHLRKYAKLVKDEKVLRIHKEKAVCKQKLAVKKQMKKQEKSKKANLFRFSSLKY